MTNQMITEPDWDNAPEGAEEFTGETESDFSAYYRKDRQEFHIDPRQPGHPRHEWYETSFFPDNSAFIKRPTEGTGLNRPDAIRWCLSNLREFTGLGIIGRGHPEGWTFASENGELILCHTFHDPIKKVDFEMAKPEEAWVPEVGGRCLLLNNQEYGVEYGLDVIGKEVKLISVNKNSLGVDVATIEYDHSFYCFRLDMLHPPKTQEEIEREEGIKALTELVGKSLSECNSYEDFACMIWDAGYRLTEK